MLRVAGNCPEQHVVCFAGYRICCRAVWRKEPSPLHPLDELLHSIPLLSVQVALQAGDAYISRATVVAHATSNRACLGMPCVRRIRKAYKEEEQEARIRLTWSVTVSFSPMLIP